MQRLSKILASFGVASRRACEEIIKGGRVSVNGEIVTIPQFMVDTKKDKIVLDGKHLFKKERKVYYVLNKPKGFVSSNCKTVKRRVIDLFPKKIRLFTVGRLDKATTGLIFVTNDGHFTNAVIHPSSDVEKEYLIKVDKDVSHKHLVTISKGAYIEGKKRVPISVKKVRKNTLKIIISEGKKHEVRIFIKKAGLKVLNLTRIRIGFLKLGKLKEGDYREMKEKEVLRFLKRDAKLKTS